MISQEDKDFLETNRGHYNTAVNAGFIQDLGQNIKQRMVDIIKAYFAPAYLTNLWCGPCIIDMVKYLYTQYDAMPIIKKETFPKHDEPVDFVITNDITNNIGITVDGMHRVSADIAVDDTGNTIIEVRRTGKGRKPKAK